MKYKPCAAIAFICMLFFNGSFSSALPIQYTLSTSAEYNGLDDPYSTSALFIVDQPENSYADEVAGVVAEFGLYSEYFGLALVGGDILTRDYLPNAFYQNRLFNVYPDL